MDKVRSSSAEWCPERGDVVWADFEPCLVSNDNRPDPPTVRRCPVLVVSPAMYNGKTGLAIVCLVSIKLSAYPFDVLMPDHLPQYGTVVTDQLRTIDWRSRRAVLGGRVTPAVIAEVLGRIAALLSFRD